MHNKQGADSCEVSCRLTISAILELRTQVASLPGGECCCAALWPVLLVCVSGGVD